jgi:hypothetical protein
MEEGSMIGPRRFGTLVAALTLAIAGFAAPAAATPEGQITWGVHVTLAPTWLDPAETPGIITPFMVMYALHEGMVQQLMHEKAMFIPMWELAFINAQGPRVEESGLGLIPGHAYSAPYEDVKLKAGAK